MLKRALNSFMAFIIFSSLVVTTGFVTASAELSGSLIPQNRMSVYASSYYQPNAVTNRPSNALDGDSNSHWLSDNLSEPAIFTVNLGNNTFSKPGKTFNVTGITVLPRPNAQHLILNYEVSVSIDSANGTNGTWTPVASGTFEKNVDLKTVDFNGEKAAKYIKITAADGGHAAIAELNVYSTDAVDCDDFSPYDEADGRPKSIYSTASGTQGNAVDANGTSTCWNANVSPLTFTVNLGDAVFGTPGGLCPVAGIKVTGDATNAYFNILAYKVWISADSSDGINGTWTNVVSGDWIHGAVGDEKTAFFDSEYFNIPAEYVKVEFSNLNGQVRVSDFKLFKANLPDDPTLIAEYAVAAAESTFARILVETALDLVNALDDGTVKSGLLSRLAEVENMIAAIETLEISGIDTENILEDFILPLTGTGGVSVSWLSNNEDVISVTGENASVTRTSATAKNDVTVILTATVTKGNLITSKIFAVTVKKADTPTELSGFLPQNRMSMFCTIGNQPNYVYANALDENAGSFFTSVWQTNAVNFDIVFNLGSTNFSTPPVSPSLISEIRITPRSTGEQLITKFDLYVSADSTDGISGSWTKLDTVVWNYTGGIGEKAYGFSAPVMAKYVKLNIEGVRNSSYSIAEFNAVGVSDFLTADLPRDNMSVSATASGSNRNQMPINILDDSFATYWSNERVNADSVTINLGNNSFENAPSEPVEISALRIAPRVNRANPVGAYKIEYTGKGLSDDEWITAEEGTWNYTAVAGKTDADYVKVVAFGTPVMAKYIRITGTSASGIKGISDVAFETPVNRLNLSRTKKAGLTLKSESVAANSAADIIDGNPATFVKLTAGSYFIYEMDSAASVNNISIYSGTNPYCNIKKYKVYAKSGEADEWTAIIDSDCLTGDINAVKTIYPDDVHRNESYKYIKFEMLTGWSTDDTRIYDFAVNVNAEGVGGTVNGSINMYNAKNVSQPFTLMASLYSRDGDTLRLERIIMTDDGFERKSVFKAPVRFENIGDKDYVVKLFIWDGFRFMTPVRDALSGEI